MERRDFLKLAVGVAAGAAALSAGAQAAPLSPQAIEGPAVQPHGSIDAQPAVIGADEAAQLKPEQVHWGWHHRHWGWHHRHWGWRRRHWGWHHHWHRRWRRW